MTFGGITDKPSMLLPHFVQSLSAKAATCTPHPLKVLNIFLPVCSVPKRTALSSLATSSSANRFLTYVTCSSALPGLPAYNSFILSKSCHLTAIIGNEPDGRLSERYDWLTIGLLPIRVLAYFL